jgi:hypothetical protein
MSDGHVEDGGAEEVGEQGSQSGDGDPTGWDHDDYPKDIAEDELTAVAGPARGERRTRRIVAPGEGERNAMVGYVGQYQLAAHRILAELNQGRLERVLLADVRAGQIDDFQIGTPSRVDAHQVKWSREPGVIGFAPFVNDGADQVSYVRQLADGWQRLRSQHGTSRVVVHFVTNELPSTSPNASIPLSDDQEMPGGGRTLAAFLAHAWAPAVEAARQGVDPRSNVGRAWLPALDKVAAASGLAADEWLAFLPDCELEFGQTAPVQVMAQSPISETERRIWMEDFDRLTLLLQRLVVRPDQRIEFSRDELLRHLGWTHRTEFHNTHQFPDPEIPYRGIAATIGELRAVLSHVTRGYVAVLGTPGSGKSTLLTKTLKTSVLSDDDRLYRYYAYVPEASGSNLRRGEASRFLHDMVLAMSRAGIRAGAGLGSDNVDLLAEQFSRQLEQLGREYLEHNRRTYILIDGLDHIEREQRPSQSLLKDLPTPAAVPDGVVFILGSQTDQLQDLSARIRDQLDADGRRVSIQPLEREDVLEILRELPGDEAVAAGERERIYRLSAGHPLALNYIIGRLRRRGARTVSDVLADVEPFQESIDAQYASLWARVEGNYELIRVLALMARARGPVRLDWLAAWADRQAIHILSTTLAHYFREGRAGGWEFFHNSFRAFVISKTRSLPALGGDAAMFRELATHSRESDHEAEQWDELYYLAQAGERQAVTELAQPEVLRAQFVAGRAVALIEEDVDLAMGAAIAQRDVLALTRALLTRMEFAQRSYYAGLLPLAEIRLELGEVDLALEQLHKGAELHVSVEAAMKACVALLEHGLAEEAKVLFGLAEPLDALTSIAARGQPEKDAGDEIDAWIQVAPHFRTLEDIVNRVMAVRVTSDERERWRADEGNEFDVAGADERASTYRRLQLLRALAGALGELGRWEDADGICARMLGITGSIQWWFWTKVDAWRKALRDNNVERAVALFGHALAKVRHDAIEGVALTDHERVVLAEGYLRITHDTEAARQIVEPVTQPESITGASFSSGAEGLDLYAERFTLNRVLGALCDTRAPQDVVPITSQRFGRDGEALRYAQFERGVVQLARLAGVSWNALLSVEQFVQKARPLVRVLSGLPQSPGADYIINSARGEFYEVLVDVASRAAPGSVAALRELLDSEWNGDDGDQWLPPLIRTIVIKFVAIEGASPWATEWLERLEPREYRGESLETELELAVEQVRGWIAVGDVVAARRCLERALSAAFGNETKDDQLASCLDWMERANAADPANAPERIAQMAVAVASLEGAEAARYVAGPLLTATGTAGATLGLTLLRWGFSHHLQEWTAGLPILLREAVKHAPRGCATLSALYRHLVLPFDMSPDEDLVRALGEALRTSNELTELSHLIESIEVSSLSSRRGVLRDAVTNTPHVRSSDSGDDGVIDPTDLGKVVDAFEGLALTLRQLQVRVQSTDDVVELVGRLKPQAYTHRWDLILGPFIENASVDELIGVADALPDTDRSWKALTAVGNRLAEAGDHRAESVARRTLAASTASGWQVNYDGGSRLSGFELLARVNGHEGRQEAWNVLARDLAGEGVRPRGLTQAWDRIAPLLDPTVDPLAIWEIISEHVKALVAFAPRPEPPVLPSAEDPSNAPSAMSAFCAFAAEYLDHPGIALGQRAQRFFVDRLTAGDAAAQSALVQRLRQENAPRSGALRVLSAVATTDAPLEFAAATLESLRQSPNYRDRRMVAGILRRLGRGDAARPAQSIRQPLPGALVIIHPRMQLSVPDPVPAKGAMLPPARSAYAMVRIYAGELRRIAKMAEVQPEALFYYVAENAGLAQQGTARDEELNTREMLNGMGLEITYRRPRPQRVEQAMLEAISLLMDRGWLEEKHEPFLDKLVQNADPRFLVYRPSPRPALVRQFPERAASDCVAEGWTAGVDRDASAVGKPLSEDRFVVAEESWIRWLDWKLATETRVGARVPIGGMNIVGEIELHDDEDSADHELRAGAALSEYVVDKDGLLDAEYERVKSSSPLLVVRNNAYKCQTPAHIWLAFNPHLALHLEWRRAADGLFRWIDAAGNVMAESIWWEDGFVGHRAPQFSDEVGQGWLVVVSADAVRQIEAAIGPCADWMRVEREAREQESRVTTWIRATA